MHLYSSCRMGYFISVCPISSTNMIWILPYKIHDEGLMSMINSLPMTCLWNRNHEPSNYEPLEMNHHFDLPCWVYFTFIYTFGSLWKLGVMMYECLATRYADTSNILSGNGIPLTLLSPSWIVTGNWERRGASHQFLISLLV